MLNKTDIEKLANMQFTKQDIDNDFYTFAAFVIAMAAPHLPEHNLATLKFGWEACKLNQKKH